MSTPDSLARVLAQHVHTSGQPHRMTIKETLALRCHDCARTIDLRALLIGAGSTSTSTSTPTGTAPPPLRAADRCPDHPGQTAGLCGPCRSEQLAADDEHVLRHFPTADVAAGAAAARQALADIAARRRTHTEETADA